MTRSTECLRFFISNDSIVDQEECAAGSAVVVFSLNHFKSVDTLASARYLQGRSGRVANGNERGIEENREFF
jgi:hypothetical protein